MFRLAIYVLAICTSYFKLISTRKSILSYFRPIVNILSVYAACIWARLHTVPAIFILVSYILAVYTTFVALG